MRKEKLIGLVMVAGAAIFLLGLVGFVFHRLLPPSPQGFGPVAALMLVGFAAFLGIMNILSFSARLLEISDAKQAFGLPEGSVRAILTISFIVLVGVLASYLVTNSDNHAAYARDPIVVLRGVSLAEAQAKEKAMGALVDGLVGITPFAGLGAIVQTRLPPADPSDPPVPPAPPAPALFDVNFYPKIDHRLGDDVSKQILTMLSTILAAMIGFYFGAKPGEADPEATRRAQASATMEAAISGAPDTDALGARVDALTANAAAPLSDAMAKELADLKASIATQAGTLQSANQTRLSLSTTATQMTAAAAVTNDALAQLQKIEKRLGELEKK